MFPKPRAVEDRVEQPDDVVEEPRLGGIAFNQLPQPVRIEPSQRRAEARPTPRVAAQGLHSNGRSTSTISAFAGGRLTRSVIQRHGVPGPAPPICAQALPSTFT